MRTEFGARIARTGTIYMHDASLSVVSAWITEYSSVTPIELVRRESTGDTFGLWHL